MAPTTENQGTFNDELRGALFRNDKGDNPARPDYRGRCVIDGKGYKISGWIRRAKASNQQYLSIAFTRDETLDPGADAVADAEPEDHPF